MRVKHSTFSLCRNQYSAVCYRTIEKRIKILYDIDIEKFARKEKIPLADALSFFYHSSLYQLMSEGVSDLHCMSDDYLVDDLNDEYIK